MSEFIYAQHAALLAKETEKKRARAASQISRLRALEYAEVSYPNNSNLLDYLKTAGGLQAFLDHARKMDTRTVLDVGTGTGNALSEVAASKIGKGLVYIGTTLTNRPHVHPKDVEVHITSAENLSRIPAASVGGILGLRSIAFSRAPELVVSSMDDKLVEGGAIKATFRKKGSYGEEWDRKYDAWNYSVHDPFTKQWAKLGYDMALMETPGDDILVMVKPGVGANSAMELLEADIQTLPEQIAELAA